MMFHPSRLLPKALLRRAVLSCTAGWFVAGFSLAGWSQETVITLKNGDRLSGTNLVESVDAVSLNTALGVISIPRGLIERTETEAAPPPVPVPEPASQPPAEKPKPAVEPRTLARQYQELLAQYESGKLSASEYHIRRSALLDEMREAGYTLEELKKLPPPEQGPAAAAAPKDPTPKTPDGGSKPKIKSQFSGEARLGTDLLFGTKDQQIYTAKLKGVHSWGRLKNSADYMFTYGHADGDLSANRMDGSLKSDWQLTERLYTYNLGGAGYDEIRRVDLRYEMGPGLGYHLFKKKGFVISGETGIHYQTEKRRNSPDQENFYFRFADIASWTINSKLSVDQKFEWLPKVEDFHTYQMRLESNLRYKLAENLSLVFTVIDRYQTDPANKVDNNDLQVRSSIGVTF